MLRIDRFSNRIARLAIVQVSVVLFQILFATASVAADWYTGAAPKPNDSWIVAVDAVGSGTSTGSRFAGLSATIAPQASLNTSGARIRIEGLAGSYPFNTPGRAERARGDQVEGAALGGYEWIDAKSAFSVYGGVGVRSSQFSIIGPGHAANGTMVGFKGVLDYYARPSERTMLSAYGSYSSNFNAYYARARWGVMAVGPFYVGPEVAALGDDFFRQYRAGVHISAFQLGPVQFGVSGGYLLDKDGRSGGYGALEARVVY